jgi:hypothetical protein
MSLGDIRVYIALSMLGVVFVTLIVTVTAEYVRWRSGRDNPVTRALTRLMPWLRRLR